jgi:UDP-N-acetylmuramate dehydrogenase
MTPTWVAELERAFPGQVCLGEALAPHTTYRIGGPADALFEPASAAEVSRALTVVQRHGVPWFALGLGSNVLVSDLGFRGLVLRIGKRLSDVWQSGETWEVGAGVPTPLLARQTAAAGLAGVHRLVGIPGTVGGGVYMNAGAHGQEYRQVVQSLVLVTADGSVEERTGATVPWRYRSSGLGPVVVLSARVMLVPEDPHRLRTEVDELLHWRKAGTPFNEPCCGSVFRNPAWSVDGTRAPDHSEKRGGDEEPRTAGQLIEAAGMKGFRIGGAEVSRLHANYIVNTGDATADDVRRVIAAVRERVQREFGVGLELEVKIIDGR